MSEQPCIHTSSHLESLSPLWINRPQPPYLQKIFSVDFRVLAVGVGELKMLPHPSPLALHWRILGSPSTPSSSLGNFRQRFYQFYSQLPIYKAALAVSRSDRLDRQFRQTERQVWRGMLPLCPVCGICLTPPHRPFTQCALCQEVF